MATPSYFSGDTQRVLEERRRLKPQRAARRVMRGLGAGVVGATEGVSAASDYVAANPLDDYPEALFNASAINTSSIIFLCAGLFVD